MSKIIKARFVIEDQFNTTYSIGNGLNNNSSLALQSDNYEDQITPETAENIYNETKEMIEELMEDALEKADKQILEAKAEAQEILEKTQASVGELEEKAHKEGYEKGYQVGFERSSQEITIVTNQMQELLHKLIAEDETARKNYEKDIVTLVMMLTEKIIGTVVELKPEIINQIVENILVEAGESAKLTVKVNPVHLPYLKANDDQLGQNLENKVLFAEDASLQPGDCVLLTDNGFIEAKIDEQLAILRETILEVTGHAGD